MEGGGKPIASLDATLPPRSGSEPYLRGFRYNAEVKSVGALEGHEGCNEHSANEEKISPLAEEKPSEPDSQEEREAYWPTIHVERGAC